MKEKVNSTRTYDAEGFRKRAACLCFKDELKNEVLLVSSSAYPNLWVVPGGGLEPDEEPGRAAVRELLEEAGVKGRVMRYLGTFENQTRKHRTAVYILVVTEELEQWEDKQVMGRTRRWFPIEDAYAQLHDYKPFQEKYLREAVEAR